MSYYVTRSARTFQISEIYINKDFHIKSKFPNVAIIKLADPFLTNFPANNAIWGIQDLQIKSIKICNVYRLIRFKTD